MDMYFTALMAPGHINRQVLKWKLWMKDQYRCEVALRSPAHITLIPPFWMKTELENELIDSIKGFSLNQDFFEVQLDNFSNFKPRVIFIEVVENKILKTFQNDLEESLLNEHKFPFKKEERPFHPHITIATRDLFKKDFHEAWEHFKEKKYSETWTPTGISLLKHNKKNWDVIYTSQFSQS